MRHLSHAVGAVLLAGTALVSGCIRGGAAPVAGAPPALLHANGAAP